MKGLVSSQESYDIKFFILRLSSVVEHHSHKMIVIGSNPIVVTKNTGCGVVGQHSTFGMWRA